MAKGFPVCRETVPMWPEGSAPKQANEVKSALSYVDCNIIVKIGYEEE